MASLHRDPRTKNWIIMFRFEGRQYRRSTDTKQSTKAQRIKGRLEDKLHLVKFGHLHIPRDADPAEWLMSDGKRNGKPSTNGHRILRFGEVCDAYLKDQVAKADTTLVTEQIHIRHMRKMFGNATPLRTVTLDALQEYVLKRRRQRFRGKPISGRTIRKELATFTQLWSRARGRGHVEQECPIYGECRKWAVGIPKPEEKQRFQTWHQIEQQIKRRRLNEKQAKELWERLFLDEQQVAALLRYVERAASFPFIYPMFVFTAYTGARRSEVVRSQIGDLDFEDGRIKIRERKRRPDMAQTSRFVPMHPRLHSVMVKWLTSHPGGTHTFPALGEIPRKLAPRTAHHHFKKTLARSKWQVVRGFHVLRHSFGSNLARSGKVPRDTIAEWMGHTTEEMKRLYQHQFPQDGQSQISVLR